MKPIPIKDRSHLIKVLYEKCHLVKSYRTDLDHDGTCILNNTKGMPFLHFAGDTGTAIVFLAPADDPYWPAKGVITPYLLGTAAREDILNGIKDLVNGMTYCNRTKQILHFNGKTIMHIDLDKAIAIADEHVKEVKSAWASPKFRRRERVEVAS